MHFDEVIFATRRLEEMRRFYAHELGLPLLEETSVSIVLQAGTTRLTFQLPSGEDFTGAYHIAFGVPQAAFYSALAWLRQRGMVLKDQHGQEHFHSDRWDADMVYFLDPAGNVVEFIAHSDRLPVRAGGEFDGRLILQVTEVGISTCDVRGTARYLKECLNTGIFRGALDNDFAALGDQTARVILASPGRIWHPDSGVPAGIYPLMVLFSAPDGTQQLIESPPDPPSVTPSDNKRTAI